MRGGVVLKIYLFIFGLGVMGYWVLEEGVVGFFLMFSGARVGGWLLHLVFYWFGEGVGG